VTPANMLLSVATGFALLSIAQAAAPLLPDGACAVVRKAVARRDHLPETGPAGLGWFCDITPAKDSRLFIIALRTSRPTPYDNLVGWYAVDRASGALFNWNVKEQRTQPFDGRTGER
jgi:hypothetical protein